jgi:(p)ppGpp synthase/HD superfamily hydrolase
MEIVKSVPGHTEEMLVAAVLHDVVEDTETTLSDIKSEFGDEVARLTSYLTDISMPEDGNRQKRKRIDAQWYAQGPAEAQTIKVADFIDNTWDIAQHAPKFWEVYKLEKMYALDLLQLADTDLWHRAHIQIMESW